jgi:hypothetical protein
MVLIFIYPWLIAPTAAKTEKRSTALFGEITPAPTAVSHGVAASFAPKFHAMKNESAKPTINSTELDSTVRTPDASYSF